MPRRPRLIVPGQPHYLIVRGVIREPIFYTKADYRSYSGQLKKALVQYQCQLHAFVLMTNYVHLLVSSATRVGISKMLQSIGRCYVKYFNDGLARRHCDEPASRTFHDMHGCTNASKHMDVRERPRIESRWVLSRAAKSSPCKRSHPGKMTTLALTRWAKSPVSPCMQAWL